VTRPTGRQRLALGLDFLSNGALLNWNGVAASKQIPGHLHLLLGKAFLEEPKIVIKVGRLNMGSPGDTKLTHEHILHGDDYRGPIP
jgi:hypothetical protein